ncbi:hypothetical protein LTS18_004377, partial [Coniosporium uncinatum]
HPRPLLLRLHPPHLAGQHQRISLREEVRCSAKNRVARQTAVRALLLGIRAARRRVCSPESRISSRA